MTSVSDRIITGASWTYSITIAVGSVVLFCGGCRESSSSFTHLTGEAQGTTFSIKYHDLQQRDLSNAVDSIFRVIDHSMSLWDSSSVLSRFNRNDPDVEPDDHLLAVVQRSIPLSQQTDGALDLTIGPIVRLWGFHKNKPESAPDSSTIQQLLQYTGPDQFRIEDGRLKKSAPEVELDVNAIAQGYTVDVIAGYFESKAIQDYMIEIGGEVRTRGHNDRGMDWTIGIDHPQPDSSGEVRPTITTIPLVNQALATSGSYRKFHELGGTKRSHIIDPLSGYPVSGTWISVSVIANDAATADALATAFMVLGQEKSLLKAKALNVEMMGILVDSTGEIRVETTSGFPR